MTINNNAQSTPLSSIFPTAKKPEISLLSDEEWKFVSKLSAKFPKRRPTILQRFEIFEMLAPQNRPACALEFLKHLPREGFIQRDFHRDEIESIYDHSRLMRHMINEIFKNDDLCVAIGIDNTEKNKRIALRLALIHDIAEALTTDFTPTDMKIISRQDKAVMEDLACRLIFAESPKMLRMIERYEHKDTNIDRLNKVVDILEGLVDCAVMDVDGKYFAEWNKTARGMLQPYNDMLDAFGKKAIDNIRIAFEEDDGTQPHPSTPQERRITIANRALAA